MRDRSRSPRRSGPSIPRGPTERTTQPSGGRQAWPLRRRTDLFDLYTYIAAQSGRERAGSYIDASKLRACGHALPARGRAGTTWPRPANRGPTRAPSSPGQRIRRYRAHPHRGRIRFATPDRGGHRARPSAPRRDREKVLPILDPVDSRSRSGGQGCPDLRSRRGARSGFRRRRARWRASISSPGRRSRSRRARRPRPGSTAWCRSRPPSGARDVVARVLRQAGVEHAGDVRMRRRGARRASERSRLEPRRADAACASRASGDRPRTGPRIAPWPLRMVTTRAQNASCRARDERAGDDVGMAVQDLRRGMHDDIGAERQRARMHRRGGGRNRRQAGRLRDARSRPRRRCR